MHLGISIERLYIAMELHAVAKFNLLEQQLKVQLSFFLSGGRVVGPQLLLS